ncbi:MAG: DUF5691 domain-containing protein [Pseudomonadota bacterium]
MNPSSSNMQKVLRIGTSRAAPQFDEDLPAELRASLHAAPAATPEERLWLSLGALDVWNRAGYRPATATSAGDSAPSGDETLVACPPRAESTLALLLRDVHPSLRAEWLRLAAQRRCRLPARLLPAALELGTRQRELRPLIDAVLGRRGHWLARRNPDWDWACDADDTAPSQATALWETGSIEQRIAALRAWRAADPQAALQALGAVWGSEPPEHRTVLLRCLAVGLDDTDEAFLEAALDDRRKEVRTVAQGLLASLPGSQLVLRMQQRLALALRLEGRVFGADRLHVTLPQERDKAMQRDGVGAGSHIGLGEKAGWLVDMLAAVPPQHWTALFELPVHACLKMAAAGEFEYALLRGWSHALRRHPAACGDWFVELTQLWLASDAGLRGHYPQDFFALLAHLPQAQAQALLMQLVEQGASVWSQRDLPLIELLHSVASAATSSWPLALSQAIVERLRAGLPQLTSRQWLIKPALSAFASVLDPGAIDAYEADWPTAHGAWPQWEEPIALFLSTIRFRHQMYISFQEPEQ